MVHKKAIDMDIIMAIIEVQNGELFMTTANIAEIKNHLSRYLKLVGMGEPVQICKRNVAIARLVPVEIKESNKTRLGCGKGSVLIKGDLTEPAIQDSSWDMLGGTL